MSQAPARDHQHFSGVAVDEPFAPRPRRRRRRSRRRFSGRARLRLVYFSIAALWGCVLGAAALAGAMAWSGIRPGFDVQVVGLLTGACGLSVAGAVVAAKAYREAANRRRF